MSQDSIILVSILVNAKHQWHTDKVPTLLIKVYCTSIMLAEIYYSDDYQKCIDEYYFGL